MNTHEILLERDYRYYPETRFEYPYTAKALYQKKVDSEAVCETNDKLCVNVNLCRFIDHANQYEVSITAERSGQWWNLKCYSLDDEELVDKIDKIEKILICMFNSIPEVAVSDTTDDAM